MANRLLRDVPRKISRKFRQSPRWFSAALSEAEFFCLGAWEALQRRDKAGPLGNLGQK